MCSSVYKCVDLDFFRYSVDEKKKFEIYFGEKKNCWNYLEEIIY